MRGFAVIAEQGCRWGRGEAMSGRSTDGLCRTLSLGGAVCALAAGNAVVFPTDTVFGLGVSVGAVAGPQLLYELKRRDAGKPVAWLVEGSSNRPRAPSGCACPPARRLSGSSALPAVLWPSPRPTSPGPPTRPAPKISIARWWPAPLVSICPVALRLLALPPVVPKPLLPHLLASRRAIDWCHRPLLAPPPPCSTAPARPPASCARAPLPSTT